LGCLSFLETLARLRYNGISDAVYFVRGTVMHHSGRTVSVLVMLAVSFVPARAEDKPRLREIQALEEAIQDVIKKAEPSIACLLVSRRDYSPFQPGVASADQPGKLGGFDRTLVPLAPGYSQDKHDKLLRSLDLTDPDHVPESFGSGVVLETAGLILTNAHVVRNATKVYVRLPGGKGSYADIHALDPRSDLAVLKLQERLPDLKPIKLGDGGAARKGQFILSLANPFAAGFRDGSPSASWGILSNVRRRLPGGLTEIERNRLQLQQFGNLFQLDARLNLGCSGGAVLNLDGEMIGLSTAQAALSGVETPGGFALPLDAGVRRILDVLKRGEEVEYGFLGVEFDTDRQGVRLRRVLERGPAWKGGLQDRDYILSINGAKVQSHDEVFLALSAHLAGSTVEIERAPTPQGPGRKVSVTLGRYYIPTSSIAANRPRPRLGLRVDYTTILCQRNVGRFWGPHASGIPDGVLIRDVIPNSPADKASLQPDKVITHVNGKRVSTPAEFYQEMDAAKGGVELTLIKADGGDEKVKLEGK
jgi:S1-C subfamily serine protease